eukprot:COSAG01_NODE_44802_length_415_cov_1.300633_1_plen_101_part_10
MTQRPHNGTRSSLLDLPKMPCCGSRPPKADETIVAADGTRASSLGLVDHVGCGVQPQPILTQRPRPSATTTATGAPPPPAGMDGRATAAGRKGTGSRGGAR